MISVDPRDRETAKREKLALFTIAVNGQYAGTQWRESRISGACTLEQADRLRALIHGWPDNADKVMEAIEAARQSEPKESK